MRKVISAKIVTPEDYLKDCVDVENKTSEETCHDCGAKVGEYHKGGCDMEECPFCNHQLISCVCCYEKLSIDCSQEPVYSQGLNEEQLRKWNDILYAKGIIVYGDETRFSKPRNPLTELQREIKIVSNLTEIYKDEIDMDIKKMLVTIAAFTEPNTEGGELLKEWQEKYL